MTDNLTPYTVIEGEEHLVEDENGDTWAGQWQRDKMDNENMIHFGHLDDPVRGPRQPAGIPKSSLFEHLMITGATGYGGMTALENIQLQLINDGHGLCVIDPRGADSRTLLEDIPAHRRDDVVWVEPGSDQDRVVGLNIFETEAKEGDARHEREVLNITDSFVETIRDISNHWGPRADSVISAVVEQLVRADKPYNIVDLVNILNDEAEMTAFTQKFDEELDQKTTRHITELSEDEIEPILRRLNKWISARPARQAMSSDASSISISKVVEDGKILLINTSRIQQQDIKAVVTRTILSRLWATIKARKEIPDEDVEPFYLCIDEFDRAVTGQFRITDMFSSGDLLNFGVICSFQAYSRLPEDVAATCRGIKNLSLNPGQSSSAAAAVAQIHDIGRKRVQNLDVSEAVFRPMEKDGFQSERAFDVTLFGRVPPKRESAVPVIEQSLEQYGSVEKISTDMDDYGITSEE